MLTLLAHPILVTAAVVPAVWLLVKVYRVDRLDRESRPLLFLVFIAALFFLSYRLVISSAQNDKWI